MKLTKRQSAQKAREYAIANELWGVLVRHGDRAAHAATAAPVYPSAAYDGAMAALKVSEHYERAIWQGVQS